MQGVFDDPTSTLFTYYACSIQFRERLVAGIPSDAKLIEAWLVRNMGVTREEEIRELTLQTLKETGVDVDELFPGEERTFKTLRDAAQAVAAKSQTTVFKRNAEIGLYIESRQIKACLRESCNILWPWDGGANKWGGRTTVDSKTNTTKTSGGKTPRSYLIESMSIEPLSIPIGMSEATGIDLSIQHTSGPQGPRSSLGYYEYADQPTIHFVIATLRDQISQDRWADLWQYAEKHGIGAKRSQDFGRFKVTRWDRVSKEEADELMQPRPLATPTNGRIRTVPGVPIVTAP